MAGGPRGEEEERKKNSVATPEKEREKLPKKEPGRPHILVHEEILVPKGVDQKGEAGGYKGVVV